MNLQRLEGFYWVARHESYAKAARGFPYPITQPGVHQQVRRLEAELEVKLFERVSRDRVVLTARGQALFAGIAPFFERLPALEAGVKGEVVGGTVKFWASGHLMRHFVPAWLSRLQAARPDIDVALTEVSISDVSAVRSGEADLVVDFFSEPPPGLQWRQVARAQAWIVAPSHGPFAAKQPLQLGQLEKVPFVAYNSDRAARELQLKALEAHGISPRQALTADSSDTIVEFVAAGLGFSLLPSLTEQGPVAPGVLTRRLERPVANLPIFAVWRRGDHALVDAVIAARPPA
jgi:DNA-binding transcriptional LysR family regulator